MRSLAFIFAALTLSASAFDVDAWGEARALQMKEALRLREAYSNCLARLDAPAEDVTVPVDTYPDGSVKFLISAKKAQFFLDTGMVWAENVVAKKFDEKGQIDTRIDARSLVVDRYTKSGWAEGPARVCQGPNVLTGSDIYFSAAESYVRIFKGADLKSDNVDVARGAKGGVATKLKPADDKPQSARIRSLSGDYDRTAGVMLFEGDVLSEYAGEYTMKAESLYAFFAHSNVISRIVALGDVTITNKTRVGKCAMATYRNQAREIEMFGKGGAPATLVENAEGGSELKGESIKFWVDAEQVEIKNSEIVTGPLGGKGVPWATP
ncbi:MAG: hypothetical protein J6R80_03320 [Kiritimatiellae bacterium]|nr:hypothetical protein [Kiritimatiellia bacterium]